MVWVKIGNIKGNPGRDGRDGESIVGPAGAAGRDGVDGRNGHAVHRTVGVPENTLGLNDDWCFNMRKEIFFKEDGKWIFYDSFASGSGGSGGGSSGPVDPSTIDHGLLMAASLLDDDHPQYALLAGRSGGQILIGGTAANNNLIIRSTSNATKGQIYFDETTNSTSATTGAVRIAGGLGVGLDFYHDGIFVNSGGGQFLSGMFSHDGLGGIDSEAYGLSATTGGFDECLSIGPRASSGSVAGISIAIGIDSVGSDDGIALGHRATTSTEGITIGHDASGGGSATVIGLRAVGSLIDVVIGADASATGVGQNVIIGGLASTTGTTNVAIGYNSKAGSFNNTFVMGANAAATANNQFVFGTNPTDFTLGRPTGTATIGAKTLRVGDRTGTNITNTGNLTIQSGAGTGTANRTSIRFNTPRVEASGTTPHTQIQRLLLSEAEAVFNDTGADTDLRIEALTSATSGIPDKAQLLVADAGLGVVSIGRAATQTTINGTAFTGVLQVSTDTNAVNGHNVVLKTANATASAAASMAFRRSKGSFASQTVVTTDDALGNIRSLGHDGTDYEIATSIMQEVDAAVSANIVPGRFRFLTANTSGAMTEALRITSNQDVIVGNTATVGSQKFYVHGGTGVRQGTSTSAARVGGAIYKNVTDANNSGTGETDLHSYTLPANSLAVDGEHIEFDFYGTFASNANNKTLKFYWNGVALFDSTALAINGGTWRFTGRIYRDGAATQRYVLSLQSSNSTLASTVVSGTGAATLSGTVVLKVTGQSGTGSNDITAKGAGVRWLPNV